MENLTGKAALVTGSTDGVGRLVARKLGQAGARVLVDGRDAERGARVVAEIEGSGGTATFLAADLSSTAFNRELVWPIERRNAVQVDATELETLNQQFDLIAEARLIKLGKRLAVGEVEIYCDGEEEMVAHATSTYSIPTPEQRKS